MSEFTDGTAKGKTLSMVDMEQRLEALTEKCNAIPVIETGTTDVLDIPKSSGKIIEVKFNHAFQTPPKIFACMNYGGVYWSNVQIRATSSATSAILSLWNNDTYNQASDISITWMAIGQEA